MRRIVALIALAALTLIACQSGTRKTLPGPTTTITGPTVTVTATNSLTGTQTASVAPCLTADQASAIVSRSKGKQIQIISGQRKFSCADGWAYISFTIPPNPNGATDDLQLVNGTWIVADRLVACGNGTTPPAMPQSLVLGGCGD
jgi:hypothetical protein